MQLKNYEKVRQGKKNETTILEIQYEIIYRMNNKSSINFYCLGATASFKFQKLKHTRGGKALFKLKHFESLACISHYDIILNQSECKI